MEKYSDDI